MFSTITFKIVLNLFWNGYYWKAVDYWNQASPEQRPNLTYPILNPNTNETINPTKKAWKYSYETHLTHITEKRLWWGKKGQNSVPAFKLFLSEVRDGLIPKNIWLHKQFGHTDEAKKELDTLFTISPFDTPKPVKLLKNICVVSNALQDDIILDFFAGSSTTAHAVMQLNAEDNGNRKFIMVQIPEEVNVKSEAYRAGYKTISEIGKERIRRAGKKIKEDNADEEGIEDLDIGFRVLKVDSSNMKDVYYSPDEMNQSLLDSLEQKIKEDRTSDDLLFQVLLDWGVDLTLPITRENINGKTVYSVDKDTLVACFDDNLDAGFAKEIAKRKPLRAVFKESGYKQDEDKINIDQVILQFSPDTEVRAI